MQRGQDGDSDEMDHGEQQIEVNTEDDREGVSIAPTAVIENQPPTMPKIAFAASLEEGSPEPEIGTPLDFSSPSEPREAKVRPSTGYKENQQEDDDAQDF